MIGDGKTTYDHGDDGEPNAAGACSVSCRFIYVDASAPFDLANLPILIGECATK